MIELITVSSVTSNKLMIEIFGLGLGYFGWVFSHRLIMPRVIYTRHADRKAIDPRRVNVGTCSRPQPGSHESRPFLAVIND